MGHTLALPTVIATQSNRVTAAGAFLHCCYRPKAVINFSEILQEGSCNLQYLLMQFTYIVCHIQVFLDVFISLQASRS